MMIPVPRRAVAWLMGHRSVWQERDTQLPRLAAVACSPDRLVLWVDRPDGRRAVDCLRAHGWVAALLPLLSPLVRFQIQRGRLGWRPHPAGVLFALDAFLGWCRRAAPAPMTTRRSLHRQVR